MFSSMLDILRESCCEGEGEERGRKDGELEAKEKGELGRSSVG